MVEAQHKKLILAVDGSPHSNAAIDLVASIDWPVGTAVHILAIVPELWSPRDLHGEEERIVSDVVARIRERHWEAAHQVISHVTDQLHRAHADDHPDHFGIVTEIHEGRPAEVILERATAMSADLIAIGARGLRTPDEFRIGATAYKVAAHASCAVLIARPPADAPLARIVLGVDGSPEARQALRWVEALPRGAQINVISVAEVVGDFLTDSTCEPEHARSEDLALMQRALLHTAETQVWTALDCLRESEMQAWPIIRSGQPAAEIVRIVQVQDADLLVIGARGQTRAESFPLGGVAEKLIRFAPCSVLVAR
jgi:nucleotide-binding universal stress UspA family protein